MMGIPNPRASTLVSEEELAERIKFESPLNADQVCVIGPRWAESGPKRVGVASALVRCDLIIRKDRTAVFLDGAMGVDSWKLAQGWIAGDGTWEEELANAVFPGTSLMAENFQDQLSRVDLAASAGNTWDLSPKDLAALRSVHSVLCGIDDGPTILPTKPLWASVMSVTGLGAQEAMDMCHHFGRDPDEGMPPVKLPVKLEELWKYPRMPDAQPLFDAFEDGGCCILHFRTPMVADEYAIAYPESAASRREIEIRARSRHTAVHQMTLAQWDDLVGEFQRTESTDVVGPWSNQS